MNSNSWKIGDEAITGGWRPGQRVKLVSEVRYNSVGERFFFVEDVAGGERYAVSVGDLRRPEPPLATEVTDAVSLLKRAAGVIDRGARESRALHGVLLDIYAAIDRLEALSRER